MADNKSTRRYRKRQYEDTDNEIHRYIDDDSDKKPNETFNFNKNVIQNFVQQDTSYHQRDEPFMKSDNEERPRKMARRYIGTEDDTDGVFGGEFGAGPSDQFSERQQYDKERELTYEERKEALKPDYSVPPLYSIHKGKVVGIKEFGIFVELPGYSRHGLVHISQISNYKTDDIHGVVEKGDEIWVKVIRIIEDYKDTKVSLSMKYVNQKDGTDLDPENTQLIMENDRRRTGGVTFHHQKIELGAIVNTTCTKCGGKGHHAGECWSLGGKSYALLEEEQEDFIASSSNLQSQSPILSPPSETPLPRSTLIGPVPEKKEKEKKHKEHKKKENQTQT